MENEIVQSLEQFSDAIERLMDYEKVRVANHLKDAFVDAVYKKFQPKDICIGHAESFDYITFDVRLD